MNRKWALITGGARRLGRAVTLHLAECGWNVAIHYHGSEDEAAATVDAIKQGGAEAVGVFHDLGAGAEALIADTIRATGAPLHALINSAALFEHDTLDALNAATFERHMRVNALAPSQLTAAFARELPERANGAVVNILDFKLAAPYPDHYSYTLSKYALAGATEIAARALAPRVRVNAVAPGYVLAAPGQSDADFARLHDQTPLARGATPADVADAVGFLLANEAITGQTIYVDAGLRFTAPDTDFMFR
jgi:NAD(P)-dependent dehydrogenase (short-subunit alcohol dehydrogenase family)